MAAINPDVDRALAALRAKSSKAVRDGMARFAIPSDHALGVKMSDIKAIAKPYGKNHALACALWETGVYEARMLTSFIGDPARVTSAEMNRWLRDFDNWAICDAMCFNFFDRSPLAWAKVTEWSKKTKEFEKRTAFALLWSLSVHDKKAADENFIAGLALIEQASGDERNFVKKAVNMALRAVGKRNPALHAEAYAVAERLAASDDPTARWNGKDALRELKSGSVARRLSQKRAAKR